MVNQGTVKKGEVKVNSAIAQVPGESGDLMVSHNYGERGTDFEAMAFPPFASRGRRVLRHAHRFIEKSFS